MTRSDPPSDETRRTPTPSPARPRPRGTGLRAIGTLLVLAAALVALGGGLPGLRPSGAASASPGASAVASASPPAGTPGPSAVATPAASPSDGPVVPTSPGYLAERSEVVERARLAKAGVQPYAAAMDDLLAWARSAVARDPRPAERLRIKGTEGPFVDDTAAAYGLALAYVVTGDRTYGEASVRTIMAWVDTTTSTRDTCPNDGSCQTSLIIGRTAPGFVFAADLLVGSGLLAPDAEARFRTWLRDIILPTASELPNNWGDTGAFTRVVLTDYLGDREGFDAAIAAWRRQFDRVAADAHIPLEVERGKSGMAYTQEALDYKVATAVIAERRGIDLWSYVNPNGVTLKDAIDYLARYMERPGEWPWHDRVSRRAASPFWELAYAKWRDPDWRSIVRERRPQGMIGHSALRFTTLTNGIPVEG